jgi:sugar fermentation stimulation protein A
MQLPPLTDGRMVRRYKRFLADVVLADGREITAHCPNTGAMTGCWTPGAPVQLSHSDNPRRKLAWTLERVDMGAGWVGVNTHRVNPVVAEAIAERQVPSLAGYRQLRREVAVQAAGHKARLDLALTEGPAADAYVEVKCVTLLEDDRLRFPDAVSVRGLRHLDTLAALVAQGHRGVMVFALNRPEGEAFSPADTVDPAYGARLRQVAAAGVEMLALRIAHSGQAMTVSGTVPLLL